MEKGKWIGEGRTAEVFAYGDGKALKLFRPPFAQVASYEYEVAKKVDEKDVAAPRCYEMVTCEGRTGLVYERIGGETMRALLERNPMAIRRCAHGLAALQQAIHQRTGDGFPSLKKRLAGQIAEGSQLSQSEKERVLACLQKLPEGESLCHFDLHIENIMMDGDGRAVAIDWTNACAGDPCADVARTCLLHGAPQTATDAPEAVREALARFMESFGRQYLAEYQRLSGRSAQDVRRWLPVVAAARLAEGIPGHTDYLMDIVSGIL